jgi:LPXTG-motif cell wall-anchored protein
MKKFALALLAVSASIFGLSAVANAYPPAPDANVVTPVAPAAGADFTVEVGCEPDGDNVVFEFNGATQTAVCTAGSASATFTAPTAPGAYSGTYTGAATGSFSVTIAAPVVPGGGLPATGSDGTSTMTIIAFGLFAVGAGLFGVSQMRRRTVAA